MGQTSLEIKTAEHKLPALITKVAKSWSPPPNLLISEWADKYRRLSSEASAEPGKWRTSRAPYMREIMDCIKSPEVKKVIIKSPSQVGKTEYLLNLIGYYSDNEPSPMMLVQPTVEMAESFSKDRLAPMIRDTPVLNKLFSENRLRSDGNTLRHKTFPGGHISLIGANSPSNLAMRPIRVLLCDEINRYPQSAGKEGDPVKLAEKRTTTFWNKKVVLVSTPTDKGSCAITRHYEGTSQGFYCHKCPSCGEYSKINRKNIVVEKDEDDRITLVKAACRSCGEIHPELKWKKRPGKYIHKYPDNPVRGFWLNAYSSTFVSWVDIEEEFAESCKNTEDLKVFINTMLAEEWEERGESVEVDDLLARRESYTEVPEQAALLTCAVDTQNDRLELEVVAWGEGDESWQIDYRVLYGDPSKKDIWDQLGYFIESKKYPSQLGVDFGITATVVDLQGHHTQMVYQFCENMKPLKVWPIRGVSGTNIQLIKKGKSKLGKTGKPVDLYNIAVDQAKTWVYRRLKQKEQGAGFCHFPMSANETYFKGLTAESLVTRTKNGRPVTEWVLGTHKRNEPLDLRVYNYACVRMLNPVYTALKTRIQDRVEFGKPVQRKKRRRKVGILSKGID